MIYGDRDYYYESGNSDALVSERNNLLYEDVISSYSTVLELYNKTNDESILIEYNKLLDKFDTETFNEGATADYVRVSRTYKKQYKKSMKEANKALKRGDRKLAKSCFKDAIDACDHIDKEFKKITSDNAFSVVTGAVANFFYNYAIDIVVGTLVAVATMGAVQYYVIDLGAIYRFEHLVKTWDKDNKFKSANLYRNNIEYGIKLMRKTAEQNYNRIK